ncbi:MAG: integrase [Gammaproteobacteria bacterium]|jgi:integrase
MPKARKSENRGLPARCRLKHGAYYYRVPEELSELWDGKKEYRLGKTLSEAYRTWAERLELYADAKTMGELLDRYALEVIPLKAPKSQESNLISIRKLRPVFGQMPIESVKPKHVYQYRDIRGKEGKTAANRDIEVLSHCFTKAIEWGLCENHPVKGKVQKFSTPPRRRYVEDWEVQETLTVVSPFIRAYIRLKLLTGLRRGDMLSIKISDLQEDGIHITPRKTANSSGKKMVIEWSSELRASINEIMNLRKKIYSIWLFHTNRGQPYIKENASADGFDSIWQRFMKKALEKTELKERFTEHDLRAKVASDTESEHARQLLGHTTAEITERIYRRKANLVKLIK